MFLIYLLMAD